MVAGTWGTHDPPRSHGESWAVIMSVAWAGKSWIDRCMPLQLTDVPVPGSSFNPDKPQDITVHILQVQKLKPREARSVTAYLQGRAEG